jgi:leader peptidase (prepilin peptidase)/N-methyltransferase
MNLIDSIAAYPEYFLFFVFLISLMVGSFLNVVIYRLPVMLKREWQHDCVHFLTEEHNQRFDNLPETRETFNLSVPRSRCPSCGHQITAIENIPVISWLFLRGKCSACGTRISIRYPVIELTTALLSTLVAYHFGAQWFTLAAILLTWALIALTMIDFDTQLLPDNITLPFLWLGLLVSLLQISNVSLQDSVIGAMAGYMVLWIVYQVFKLLTGKEGMGFGDFKLLALLGAWFGWQQLPLILFLSALVGAAVGITLIIARGRDRNIPIPFGPYLASAGFISMLWGSSIQQAYLDFVGL